MGQARCPIHGREGAESIEAKLPGPVRRYVLFAVGSLSLVMGILGIFVPLWPTTCFFLLSAWCFSRSSQRMYRWLHENRLFGEHLRQCREHGTIAPRVRSTSLVVLWSSLALSMVLVGLKLWVGALLMSIGVAVTKSPRHATARKP